MSLPAIWDAGEAAYARPGAVLGGCWCFDGSCGVLVVAGCFWGCQSWVVAASVGGTSNGVGSLPEPWVRHRCRIPVVVGCLKSLTTLGFVDLPVF
ncbi:hypothetical protein Dimus_015508 [Dionaea muscipula]